MELDGERIDIRAGIHTLSGYSAHVDQAGLVRFVTRMRHLPAQVRLIHGDDGARAALAEKLLSATHGKVDILNGWGRAIPSQDTENAS
ncbi:MBL fold metallo-hydrolase RNA specificity domain-containing protein [Nitrogeniibacter aestuarii]|uniref:MBL fold metallo-hydrolase RNA specificity domain-containing protein n=1 Tax=Nitrogeniibacter aestuarii TaxID=2815343 RepID=UPI001D130590|nr:MBL fold metallo-hydrolase RNA specificity domain-containing protein [Nitrogeniibacter aestuarii]